MNNVKDSIGWADYTLNIITGCKRGCKWGEGGCYAKRNWNRLHRKRVGCEFEEIRFWPSRMEDPDLWRKAPCTVFVGSMSDIEYWPRENTERIIRDVCKTYYKNTYMFLTKNADSYKGFLWPPNTMQGLTMTKIISQDNCLQLIKMEGVPRPFLSIEPLLGLVGYFPVEKYELVIVGAMTGPGAIKPEPMWIRSVRDTVPKEKIYWKRNIRGYL